MSDIFISYKADGSGDQFAARLYGDLNRQGYSVFWDKTDIHAESFPPRLKEAIRDCIDFILILSKGCLEQLMRNDPVDWVREEILAAQEFNKHIVPILMEDVTMPRDASEMPVQLQFLPTISAIQFTTQYLQSPFQVLENAIISRPEGIYSYRDAYNSNKDLYDITADYCDLKKKAESGDLQAMYEFGMMCFYGAASETPETAKWNYEQAAKWLKAVMSAESESDLKYHAASTLGRMYYQGLIPWEDQSYEEAYKYHSMAAAKDGYSSAEKLFLMRLGVGCKFDYNAVIEYYDKPETMDDVNRQEFAEFLTAHGNFHKAKEVYESIKKPSAEAQYQLGLLYLNGLTSDPPTPNCDAAANYLHRAADRGHISAAYELAKMSLRPIGNYQKDFREAEKYFKIAANGGKAEAQYMLGYLYRTGLSGEVDLENAIYYLECARKQSYTQAALELASIYQQPEYRNFGKAYVCAMQAADDGMGEGELILGNLLFWGRGCSADINRAYKMYQKAKEHGMYYAEVMMEKIRQIKQQN